MGMNTENHSQAPTREMTADAALRSSLAILHDRQRGTKETPETHRSACRLFALRCKSCNGTGSKGFLCLRMLNRRQIKRSTRRIAYLLVPIDVDRSLEVILDLGSPVTWPEEFREVLFAK